MPRSSNSVLGIFNAAIKMSPVKGSLLSRMVMIYYFEFTASRTDSI